MAVVQQSMRVPSQAVLLPGGRLHLQHGPIDLIVHAEGAAEAVRAAYAALTARFTTMLDELCLDLPALRQRASVGQACLGGRIARRMQGAVLPFAGAGFITPMAAVAGAVADEALTTLCRAAPLRRAFVNNGGDIAIHLSSGHHFQLGLIDRPDRPGLFARATVTQGDGIGGVATSGWRGRSFSLGVADAVTICAATAAQADAAATVVANAVDLPGHPAVHRLPADTLQPDSDLGGMPVTRDVGPLRPADIARAIAAGLARADGLVQAGLIAAAALHCQGQTRVTGTAPGVFAGPRKVE